MKSIAVLLTVFNRREATVSCLEALHAQEIPAGICYDVWLTDDGCTDGTSQIIAKQFPEVHILTSQGNLFWNRGMIYAWKAAAAYKSYDAYLWLNDDTILYPFALKNLVNTALIYDSKSIIVGTTCAFDNTSVITYGGRLHKKGLLFPNNMPCECDYFNGNIVLIPNFVYRKIGMNDIRFHHALGDFDYGMRAHKKGIKSVVAPCILGMCDVHKISPVWCDPKKNFIERWRMFRTPLGHNPEEFIKFELRHYGLFVACFHYFTAHLRVVFPSLWKK